MKNKFNLRTFSQISIFVLFFCLSNYLKGQCNANFNYTIGAGGNAVFASTSTGTTASTTYTWKVGNGQFSNWSSTFNHIFLENQVATVTLQISDATTTPTCSSTITKTLSITSAPCFSSVTIYTVLGSNGVVSMGAQPIGSANGTYTYNWAFGDGGVSNQQYPSHTYTAGGIYTVSLSASGYSSICNYSTTKTISVTIVACNISAAFTYTSATNGLVHFTGTSTGTVSGTTYNWNFNDGSPAITGYLSDTISHQFPSNIIYPVNHAAIISSPLWCTDSLVQMISVSNATACSAYSHLQLHKDTTQNFTWFIQASYPPNVSNVSWDWGDNSTSSGLFPSHSYSAAGIYYIQAVVTVSCGSSYTYNTGGYIYKASSPNEAQAMITVNVKKTEASTVGFNSPSRENIKAEVWPNPNNGFFELKVEGLEANSVFDLKISNLLGQSVYLETFKTENTSVTNQLKLDDLPAGTYFLRLDSKTNSYVTKIIVSH